MNPNGPHEARRDKRHRVEVVVPVVDAMSMRALGFTRDLSRGGMKLITPKPLVHEALYQLQMELDGPNGTRIPLEVAVQVLSQEQSGRDIEVRARFIHVDIANAERLAAWLAAREA